MIDHPVHPYADLFPLISDSELEMLADDIKTNGLREPIWLHADGRIIDGRNRYRACKRAEVEPDYRTYDGDDADLLTFVISLNMRRRHLDESQRAMVAAKISNLPVGANQHNGPEGVSIDTPSMAEAGSLLNVGRASVARARKVHEQASPELVEAVETGRISVSAAAGLVDAPVEEQRRLAEISKTESYKEMQAEIHETRARIDAARANDEHRRIEWIRDLPTHVASPEGKYQCVVMDPPWPMKKIEREERPNQGVELDYPTMELWCQEPRKDLIDEYTTDAPACFGCIDLDEEDWEPCQSIECVVGDVIRRSAADDCHIYMWVTHKYLPAGLDMLRSWGFNYQCLMTWRKNVGITPFSWMYDTEHVLFGRRGNLPLERLGLRLSFDAPVQGHSVKPDVFYERVLEATPGPRLEMFARREREGFKAWGNEVSV